MSTALTTPQASQWESREMVETLKQTVCKGATDSQFRMFIEVCKATGLNPFLKEIWYVPSVGVMAGRDGYLRVANEHPMFDGMETRVERDEKNIPIKAVCTVWRKDRNHPIVCEAYYSEYKKGGNVWSTYPSAMIAKVAEVLALKRSFAINGIVTEEEIGTGEGAPRETPQEVAERQIKDNNRVRAERGLHAIEAANPQPEPISTPEQRHAALVLEANAILEEPATPKAERKKGGISFKALGEIGTMKAELRKLTGTDEEYYQILSVFGVTHADELTPAQAKDAWKALAGRRKKIETDNELRTVLHDSEMELGVKQFSAILGSNGCENVQHVMELMADPLTELLADLKRAVDAKKKADAIQ